MLSSSNPNGCFCCTTHSREQDEKKIRDDVIPLAPDDEWNLPWNPEQLFNETGSKDITNFFVLKRVFLFLHCDLVTLLNVSQTCRSWRVLSDRLPHWRYLLPLRNEIMPIASHMKWHHPPNWEREYFHVKKKISENRVIEELHYRYVRAGSVTNKYLLGPVQTCLRRAKQHLVDIITCGESSCCDSSCCCTSCESSEDDRELQTMEDEKRAQFLKTHNQRRALLELRQDDDAELAERAFAPHKKVVDWLQKLQQDAKRRRQERKMRKGTLDTTDQTVPGDNNARAPYGQLVGDGSLMNNSNNTMVQQTSNEGNSLQQEESMNLLASSREVSGGSDTSYGIAETKGRKENNNDDDENDDNDDDNVQTFPIFTSDDTMAGYLSNTNSFPPSPSSTNNAAGARKHLHRGRQHQQQRRLRPSAAAAPAANATANNHSDNTDTGTDSEEDDITTTGNPTRSVHWGDDVQSNEGEEGMPNSTRSLDPSTMKEAKIKRITPRQAFPFGVRQQLTKEQLDQPIRYSHQTLHENRLDIMSGLRYRQEWMFTSLSSYLQFCREAKKRFQIEGRVSCCDFYGPTLKIQVVATLALVAAIAIASLYGLQIEKTNVQERSDSTIVNVMSLIVVLALLLPLTVFGLVYAGKSFDSLNRDPTWMKTLSFLGATSILITFCVPLALVGFRTYSVDLILNKGNISVCHAIPKFALSNDSDEIFKVGNENGDYFPETKQCRLPEKFLPKTFMDSSFLYLPPGTKILYHPPPATIETVIKDDKTNETTTIINETGSYTKVLPYTATFSSNGINEDEVYCKIEENKEVDIRHDLGFNNSRAISDRSHIGYYTIILPPSCDESENYVRNFTVIILGNYPSCPFWSKDSESLTIDVWWLNLTEFPIPRNMLSADTFDVLNVTEATDAIDAAQNISSNLSRAVSSAADEPTCKNATNAMITVMGDYEYNTTDEEGNVIETRTQHVHDFFLRTANRATPHYTSSYFLERPSDYHQAAQKTWQHESLDYSLNGIPILVADTDIFLAHAGHLEQKQDSDNVETNNRPTMVPPFSTEWDDNTMSWFWTAAHPAGLRKIRDDMRQGFIGLLSFILVSYVVCWYLSLFARGFSRFAFGTTVMIFSFLWTVFPIGFVILATVCFIAAPQYDAGELTMPVTCLATKRSDLLPFFVYSCVIAGIAALIFICFIIYLIVDECGCDDCCDDCCSSSGCCGDCCCDCCSSNGCCCCCCCCSDCCSSCC